MTISLSIPFCFSLQEYNHDDFVDFIVRNLTLCPLCKESHLPKILCLTERYVKQLDEKKRKISIIRIICPNNQKKRREDGVPVQYTLTILPAFLIPHSRIQLNILEKALTAYENTPGMTTTEAALMIGCENHKSFELYLKRARSRIQLWISFILHMITDLTQAEQVTHENTTGKDDFYTRWKVLYRQLAYYHQAYRKLPGTGKVPETVYFLWFHTHLTPNRLGLGP